MNFTFGIITNGYNYMYIKKMITSIHSLNIPFFEILIIGGNDSYDGAIHIPFDETIKANWITRKKNIICQFATYENIVLLHDYVDFYDDWYKGFLKFGNDFDICTTRINNVNGVRFRDYVIFPFAIQGCFAERALIPYDYQPSLKLSKIMYISGTYYVIKKHIALKFPLDERITWGKAEDVEFSKRLACNNIIMKCNPFSTVIFQKYKDVPNWHIEMTPSDIQYFESLSDEDIDKLHLSQLKSVNDYLLTVL